MASTINAESLLHLAQNPPQDSRERFSLYEAARRLMLSVEDPMSMGSRLTAAAVSQVAIDLKIFELLIKEPNEHWSVDDLEKHTGAEASLLDRLMRNLAVNNLVLEVASSTYSASHLTARCASAAFRAGLAHSKNLIWPGLQVLPTFLAENGYQNPRDHVRSACMRGVDFDGDAMAYLKENPEQAAASYLFMAENKKEAPKWVDGKIPTTDLILSEEELADSRVMLVDVGGGSGHQCEAIRKAFPHLKGRILVEDLPFMVNRIDKEHARTVGFEVVAHDFFKPQPIRGAKVYYMRNVIHDWDDERASAILQPTHEAMAKDSVLFIDEIILPKVGASSRQVHMDMAVMVFAGAMERTDKQWKDLLGNNGFEIRDIWVYDEQLGAAILAAVPKSE
ncbi:similar to o-methyltransferase [Plenodomus lingam JN3]|uniref:Similar to o-methyltransferase n=1 Tax=Leptosphaeria maculans (strain JN3 / isolate v23.1.3 / race Av1-4-5-6-7-8) TaxID=985895 RepID=E5A5R5_LEPMJ|nr:similar to o-methyltransferase [Plenodomus lingam JN3]CBX98963.1 similar to o-methyltransferase [Plenodomus lingam JN3]